MSRQHALLSASSANRWINCPPSAKLQEQYEDKGSIYAEQGTDAHALAEWKLRKALGIETEPDPRPGLSYYDEDMEVHTDDYVAFIMEQLAETRKTCDDPLVMVEQRVDYSRWVDGGFGTADAILVSDGRMTIVDLKYGTGVEVSAEGNPQTCCYALGALDLLDDLYAIDIITMIIFQPRRENVSEWTISRDDLLAWADNTLHPAAMLAAEGKGEYHSGEHCRFCKARHECRSRAEEQYSLMRYDFDLPPTLTDEEVEEILGKADQLIRWAEDIKEYALQSAIGGKHWKGYKLVEGRSNRRFTDEQAVAKAVMEDGKEPYEKRLLGITAMTSLLGRKRFNELLGKYVEKPRGKATLVAESDKRPAMDFASFNDANDYHDENEKGE